MDYEKIILELLSRIQILEEKVEKLTEEKIKEDQIATISTEDIRKHINELKDNARSLKKASIILVARDIHRELNLKSRFPMVCNAMRQCMEENDVILFQPPSGNSSTLEIEYKL